MTPAGSPSAAFWSLMERWSVPDAEALALIEFPGKLGKAGKRPRFRLITSQVRLAASLLEVDNALTAIGYGQEWLHRRIRGSPFSGRSPLSFMIDGKQPAITEVLGWLTRAGLEASLRCADGQTAGK